MIIIKIICYIDFPSTGTRLVEIIHGVNAAWRHREKQNVVE